MAGPFFAAGMLESQAELYLSARLFPQRCKVSQCKLLPQEGQLLPKKAGEPDASFGKQAYRQPAFLLNNAGMLGRGLLPSMLGAERGVAVLLEAALSMANMLL